MEEFGSLKTFFEAAQTLLTLNSYNLKGVSFFHSLTRAHFTQDSLTCAALQL